MSQLYDTQGWGFQHELRTKYGPVSMLRTLFSQPMLCIYDPAAMNAIVMKDQQNRLPLFEELEWYMNLPLDVFGPGLLSTTGETHRKQRKLLSPVFSTKNLRLVTPVFHDVAHRLTSAISAAVIADAKTVDVAQYMTRAALVLIGQAVLGHCFDPLTEEGQHPYAEALKCYIPALTALTRWTPLYRLARPLMPTCLRRPLMNLLPSRRVQELLRIVDTMHANAIGIYNEKKVLAESLEKADENHETTTDLITLLLRANAGASQEDALPEEELIAQLSILMFAATDTTSNSLTIILDRLASSPPAQDRLRAELVAAKSRLGGGDISYDELMSLPYLDAVCAETLRVHVPAPLRFREAQADALLPLSKPIRGKDGTMMDSISVPKGTVVFVPIQAANINPEVWGPDAHEWRPERWLEPLPKSVAAAKTPGVYSNIMTFWGGRRSCIGFKFAQLEMKVVLAELIATFVFDKTDAPVIWNFAEIVHPTVGADSWHPEYLMKVTLAQETSASDAR
ncbi:cytochrome P450 [Trametes versicolor FP-101664 SS1]|uniref:cytochrome P450 n=1 Tax=Trametes versicolor (strain FP-101664) TaxID=717944 RepID=UPI0004624995|nr:cytochrome P450 [Trametes versicolor FP-101664 SS1]EIW53040.1 cytochrome P450 [Trametes versicolor FP-101664 SS1]